jgi:uncharacterized protein
MTVSDDVNVYGSRPPEEKLKSVTLKDPELIGMRYPIPKNPERGYFSKSVNASLVNSGLKDLIKTERGERFMLPDYGCNVRNFLFEPLDEGTFLSIKEDIVTSIRKYLKKVSIGKLQVFQNAESGLQIILYCGYDNAQIPYFRTGVTV